MSDIDSELTKRFAELRAADEANAPEYEAIRRNGRADVKAIAAPRRRKRWNAPALLASAAAVLVAIWVAVRASSPDERARQQASLRDSSMHVFRWTMPTDGLLRSARQTLQTPALFGSVLDAAAVPILGTPFKGD